MIPFNSTPSPPQSLVIYNITIQFMLRNTFYCYFLTIKKTKNNKGWKQKKYDMAFVGRPYEICFINTHLMSCFCKNQVADKESVEEVEETTKWEIKTSFFKKKKRWNI